MIKNREIERNLVKFRPDLIKSERAMGYLTGSLGLKSQISTHFLIQQSLSGAEIIPIQSWQEAYR